MFLEIIIIEKNKYIWLDMRLKNYERFVYVENDIVIDDELEIKVSHCRKICYPTYSTGLYVRNGKNYDEDLFDHEIYLMIHDNKNVLLSGCAHKGILNIMNWFSPNVMIGEFHLKKQDIINDHSDVLDRVAKKLMKYTTTYYTGHCTGIKQYEYLKDKMNEQLFYLSGGTIVEI